MTNDWMDDDLEVEEEEEDSFDLLGWGKAEFICTYRGFVGIMGTEADRRWFKECVRSEEVEPWSPPALEEAYQQFKAARQLLVFMDNEEFASKKDRL